MGSGFLIDGRYKILEVIGKGGMSTVYLAENTKLGTLWAIKEIKKLSDSKIDLLAEQNILKRLNHPALPRIFDVIESEDSIYIIVDYIEGSSLDKELEKEGTISEARILGWAKQLCDVLMYLHSQLPNPIIYRDMKPSNIILCKDNLLKLIDFGTAREYKEGSDTDTVYIGTRGYAAPEQYGLGQTDVTTDIYGLGITLFHLVTGRNPNSVSGEINSIRCYNPEVSAKLEEIICKCVRYNPAERYQTVEELLNEIRKADKYKHAQTKLGNTIDEQFIDEEKGSVRVISFRRLVLSVMGSAEFASNFAYLASTLSDYKVALVDLDSLNPMSVFYLDVDMGTTRKQALNGSIFDSGVDLLLEGIRNNGSLTFEDIVKRAAKRNEAKNLFIFTGNSNWKKYGKYNDEEVRKLIELMYKNFDLTILILNSSVKEPQTLIAVSSCDYIISVQRPYSDEILSSIRAMEYFRGEHNIEQEKIKYVLYDTRTTGHEESFVRHEGFGLGESLIGSIRNTDKYERCRNRNTLYIKAADTVVVNDYKKLLEVFGIVPKQKLTEAFLDKLKNIRRLVKSETIAKF